MRLLIEEENGALVEVKKLEGVSAASKALVLMCSVRLHPDTACATQEIVERATGKRCVILGPEFAQVIGV